MAATSGGDREKELAQLKNRVPAADYAAFEKPGRVESLGAMIRECMRQGAKGAAWDMRLYMRDFDFSVGEVRMPLHWFHGEQDSNAPIAMVRRIIAELPRAQLVTFENESHLSTLCNHLEPIVEALVG